jgi:hypothetical protein
MAKEKKERGRPRKPEGAFMVSQLPKTMVYMTPVLRAQLTAAANILQKPIYVIVGEALEAWLKQLPKGDRDALEMLAERISKREKNVA